MENLRQTKVLLICGSIAGPLFTGVWITAGLNRVGYSPVRESISSLSRGSSGWIQIANFICTGLLTLALSIGVRRILRTRKDSIRGAHLIGVISIGLLIGGIFKGDKSLHLSFSSALHLFSAVLVFLGMPFSCFEFAGCFSKWHEFGWMVYARITGILFTIVGLVFTMVAFARATGLANYVGLWQRITITIGWIWLTLLAIHLLKTTSTGGEKQSVL